LFSDGGGSPATPATVVSVSGTSFGPTNPSFAPGEFPSGAAPVTGDVKVTIGGREIPSENVVYAGVVPSSPGKYELRFKMLSDMPDGDHELILTIAGVSSPPGPYITVKAPSSGAASRPRQYSPRSKSK